MTVNVARRRTRSARPVDQPTASAPVAIGELGQTVFSCPACNRPLALGARRCPGCSTRLIMRVQARRAAAFVGLGLVVGLAIGGIVTATSFLADQPARDAAVARAAAAAALANVPPPAASQAPVASHGAATSNGTGNGSGSGTGSGAAAVSALTRSAISQAAAIDARLVTYGVALQAALAATDLDAIAVSQILRTMSADAVYGLQLTSHIGAWAGGKALSGELEVFYAAIKDTAAEGLTASIRNEAAYEAASVAMLALLESLADLDAGVSAAAGRAGVDLP
jgi:hypothetical protein